MDQGRRMFFKSASIVGIMLSGGLLGSMNVFGAEWKEGSFKAKTLTDAFKQIGVDDFTMSSDVSVSAAEIAENGAVVPVSISSNIPKTEYMAILVEKNPNPLASAFEIPVGTIAEVSTRLKMGETSNVFAMVKADGKWFAAKKEIKVTLGGCGG